MKFDRNMLLLYAVTDRSDRLYERLEAALKNGVTLVQLREKNLSEDEYVNKAIEIKKLCHSYNVPIIVNDNVDVAIKSGADGVHVGMEDAPVEEIRKRVDKDFIIGATAKTMEQAQAAERAGADYLGVGAVFPSPTKKNAIRITAEQLQNIRKSVNIPIVAIGGISEDNIMELKGSDVDGVAVVSAIFGADDAGEATIKLLKFSKELVNNDG